jgi:ATP-dependent Lhr-like helicase
MRRVLANNYTDPSWSERACTELELQRESHAFLEDSSLPLEEAPDGRCRWWTFGGGAGNRVLAGLLELELGERVSSGNTLITFSNGAAESAVAISQAIDALAARTLVWDDAARLIDPGQRSHLIDANATLAEWARGKLDQETKTHGR